MTTSTPPGPRPGQQQATPAGPYHYELGQLIELLAGLFDDTGQGTPRPATRADIQAAAVDPESLPRIDPQQATP